jgi:hypothetical protein
VDKAYRPQLVPGWIKRVLDRINPYGRANDFRNNDAPATYASLLQEAGQRHEGRSGAESDKASSRTWVSSSCIRPSSIAASISASGSVLPSPASTTRCSTATRISDLYMLMGNEAYDDSLDPTIGFTSATGLDLSGANPDYGAMAPRCLLSESNGVTAG